MLSAPEAARARDDAVEPAVPVLCVDPRRGVESSAARFGPWGPAPPVAAVVGVSRWPLRPAPLLAVQWPAVVSFRLRLVLPGPPAGRPAPAAREPFQRRPVVQSPARIPARPLRAVGLAEVRARLQRRQAVRP